jgi:ABC-type transporter Mla MlaB component
MEWFCTNRSARFLLTHWNKCSPLSSLSLEAPCSHGMVLHQSQCEVPLNALEHVQSSCLSLVCSILRASAVSARRCHLLYRQILEEMQCHSALIHCSKGREEKIDSLCHDIRDTEPWTFINNFAKRMFADSRILKTLINVNLSNFQMFKSAD